MNRVGTAGDGTQHSGDSRIISPLGELLAEAGDGETGAAGRRRPAEVARVRERFPFLRDR